MFSQTEERSTSLLEYRSEKGHHDIVTLYSLLPGHDRSKRIDQLPSKRDVRTDDAHLCSRDLLSNAFLSKYIGFKRPDTREKAKTKFLEYEARCRETNRRIRAWRDVPRGDLSPSELLLQSVISTAQYKISSVLGPFRLVSLLELSRWGPRTTSSCKGLTVSSPEKFASRADTTFGFLPRARLLMPLLPAWSAALADVDHGTLVNPTFHILAGNRITFVPKTSEIDRVIAVEPHINSFFQNGLGRMIRRRMRLIAKVDLEDQTLNQRLARHGSIYNDIATIDLEGASDTISRELVRELLPEDWFSWLDAARSATGILDGVEIRYEKFSSMGNGATFDLESLIFWALASALSEIRGYNSFWINVFGDDIVIPSGMYDEFSSILDSCGLIVNLKKSFHNSPFRESCGHDYLRGVPVRPVYVKRIPTTEIDWLIIANQLRKLAHQWAGYQGCSRQLKPAYDFALSRLDRTATWKVPHGYELIRGDYGYSGNGLISNFDEAAPSLAPDGWDGYLVKGLRQTPRTYHSDRRTILVSGLYQPQGNGNQLPLRDCVALGEGSLVVPSNWYDLGPWVD